MRIYLHQHVTQKKVDLAFALLEEAFANAAFEHADLLMAPEVFLTGFRYKRLLEISLQTPSHIERIKKLCFQYAVGFYGSFFFGSENEKPFNRSVLIDKQGNLIAHYNKIYLMSAYKEDLYVSAGKKPSLAQFFVTEKNKVKVGLTICYDLRFPELFRWHTQNHVQIFFISAQWPLQRVEHMLTLARARAIENQAFVVLVNAIGFTGTIEMAGCSVVFDPHGQEIINLGKQEFGMTVEIDLSSVGYWREKIPAVRQFLSEPFKDIYL